VNKIDPQICSKPFNRILVKVVVLGLVGRDDEKFPKVFIAVGEKVNADITCRLLT